jgi:hypothetical protein
MKIENHVLMVRKAQPNSGGFRFDLNYVVAVESRIEEISIVTPHKAPELLAAFNRAWLELGQAVGKLEEAENDATQYASLVKGEILLDKAEDILKSKGLKGSADLRQAVIDTDPTYREAIDKLNAIRAAREFLKIKQKAIEMAYLSVRKIVGENTYNMRNKPGAGVNQHVAVGMSETEDVIRESFGQPNY